MTDVSTTESTEKKTRQHHPLPERLGKMNPATFAKFCAAHDADKAAVTASLSEIDDAIAAEKQKRAALYNAAG